MHLLLTVLGIRAERTRFERRAVDGQRSCVHRLAPAALIELLDPDQRPDRVLAICTPDAVEKTLPILQQALPDSIPLEVVEVGTAENNTAIQAFLNTVVHAVSRDHARDHKPELTIDITHGFRHHLVLVYVACLYLVAMRQVRLRGAYYALFRSGGGKKHPAENHDADSRSQHQPSPEAPADPPADDAAHARFIDLRPLIDLPTWVHAVETFEQSGSAAAILARLQPADQTSAPQSLTRLLRTLEAYTRSFLAGLPLELGQAAARLRTRAARKTLRQLLHNQHQLPLADDLVRSLEQTAQPFAFEQPMTGPGWKSRCPLDDQELRRQARTVDTLLEHDHIAAAVGLMREWVVSWAVWRSHDADATARWLEHRHTRADATRQLNALCALLEDPRHSSRLSTPQRELAAFWKTLREIRNTLHHHAMRPEIAVGDKHATTLTRHRLDPLLQRWRTLTRQLPDIPLSVSEDDDPVVLLTPLGLKPGVLLAALQACRGAAPQRLLVVASARAHTEALETPDVARALAPLDVRWTLFDNPFSGCDEIESRVENLVDHLIGARFLHANLTGGTTLLGLAVQQILRRAEQLAIPFRRFGLVESSAETAGAPTTSRVFYLDPPPRQVRARPAR